LNFVSKQNYFKETQNTKRSKIQTNTIQAIYIVACFTTSINTQKKLQLSNANKEYINVCVFVIMFLKRLVPILDSDWSIAVIYS